MNIPRETLYAAIFAKFAGLTWTPGQSGTAGAFAVTSRRLRHWADPVVQFPALYQVQAKELAEQLRGVPTKWRLSLLLYIYVQTFGEQDASVTPSVLLNPILDAVDTALRPDAGPAGVCTLGGLVSHAWIAGEIETSEGNLGNTEVAVVPVELFVPL